MANIKQKSIVKGGEVVHEIIINLQKHGKVKVPHLGIFEVVKIKPRKRFDFIKRKVVTQKGFNKVSFKPSKSLKDFLNK